MIIDDVRKLRDQRPFLPFRIWLADGTTNYLIADARDELQILNHIQVARLGLEASDRSSSPAPQP